MTATARSFPNPKCVVEGCPRYGQNMWRSSTYSLTTYNGTGMVKIVCFSCRPDKPHSWHYAYQAPGGEVAENLGEGRGRGGRYRWRDSATGKMCETKSGHANAMAAPETRKRLSKAQKRIWKNSTYRECRIESIRKCNQNPKRREKISAAMQLRVQDPHYIEQQRQLTLASWQDPKIARRRIEGTKKALADPEVKKRQSESAKRQWAQRKVILKTALDAAATSLPADWMEKQMTWWIAGMALKQKEDYMSNKELAARLDGLIRCPYGKRIANGQRESTSWLEFFRERAGEVFANRIRNWVNKPGIEK